MVWVGDGEVRCGFEVPRAMDGAWWGNDGGDVDGDTDKVLTKR